MLLPLYWSGGCTPLDKPGSYLVRLQKKDSLGISSGYFTTFLFLGSTIGILFSGFIIQQTSYTVLFLLASIIPIFGLILSSKLKEFTIYSQQIIFRI